MSVMFAIVAKTVKDVPDVTDVMSAQIVLTATIARSALNVECAVSVKKQPPPRC